MAFKKITVLLAFGAILAGCASTPPVPPPQAVLSIDDKTCDSAVSIKDAISLTPVKPAFANVVNSDVDAKKPCINIGDKKANYIVYSLPEVPENHTITIGGVQEIYRIFAPKIFLLDANGNITREFADEKYVVMGNKIGVLLRPTEKDKFILVRSNPDVVGVKNKSHETRINASTGYSYNAYTGYGGSYTTYHGKEGQIERVFSHEGIVNVTVQALKGKIGLPDA